MKCASFEKKLCRSCDLLDRSYTETLKLKEENLKSLFPDSSHLVLKTIGVTASAEHSRSKAKLAVYGTLENIRFGFFNAQGDPQSLEECPLHISGINELLPVLRSLLEKHRITPYDINTRQGAIKYLIVTKSESSGEIMIRFVLRSKDMLDPLKRLSLELRLSHPEVKVTTANIQPIPHAIVEGDEEIVLTEQSAIQHQFDEFSLNLGPRSFFQVTPEIAKELYRTFADRVQRDQPKTLLDLYCGVGAFSFYASRGNTQVTGIELSREAVVCAELTQSDLQIKNIQFHALDVEQVLKSSNEHYEAILANPPRRGLNDSIISSLLRLDPKWIYYSSCNAVTLSRDYAALSAKYFVESLQIFDLFPYTSHYETFLVLKRK